MRTLFITLVLSLVCSSIFGQTGRVDKHERLYELADRYASKNGYYPGFQGISPLYRSDIDSFLRLIPQDIDDWKLGADIERMQMQLSEFQEKDPWEEEAYSWYKRFYANRAHLFEIKTNKVWFALDPILYLRGGYERETKEIILQNTRGIRLRGALGKSVYFASSIYENQASFQDYHERTINRLKAIPGQSLYKNFNFNLSNKAYDYLNADGYLGLRLNRFMNMELGHGRHFVGHGIRSLILSDYATNYFYLKLNTRFWKFNYQNLFAELAPLSGSYISGDRILPKKYMAQHILSYQVNERLQLSLAEIVMFSRPDHFEFQYLNPLIFYRAVEQFLNSPDNALMAAQFKYHLFNGLNVYGQFILDEFNIGAIRKDFNWWGNKFGIQGGFKAYDVLGVPSLDIQSEVNMVRPYTYSHSRPLLNTDFTTANYSHFSQALAHPLGANFFESISHLKYKITNKLGIQLRYVYAAQGQNSSKVKGEKGYNIGADILQNNITKDGSTNQKFLQGSRVTTRLMALNSSYEIWPNYFLDLNLQYRIAKSVLPEFNGNNTYIGLGIRVNYYQDYRDY